MLRFCGKASMDNDSINISKKGVKIQIPYKLVKTVKLNKTQGELCVTWRSQSRNRYPAMVEITTDNRDISDLVGKYCKKIEDKIMCSGKFLREVSKL